MHVVQILLARLGLSRRLVLEYDLCMSADLAMARCNVVKRICKRKQVLKAAPGAIV